MRKQPDTLGGKERQRVGANAGATAQHGHRGAIAFPDFHQQKRTGGQQIGAAFHQRKGRKASGLPDAHGPRCLRAGQATVDLTDEQILERLLALNLERAAEEAKAAKQKKPKAQRAKSADEMV